MTGRVHDDRRPIAILFDVDGCLISTGGAGTKTAGLQQRTVDAETTPLRDPDSYQYQLDLGDIAEVWRRGSVIASWLLDLTAQAFLESPDLADFAGRVSDSGEGRWTSIAAIDVTAPAPVLTTALYARVHVARRGGLRRQDPVRDAPGVRRARRDQGLRR